ncbi:MAG: cupredoxin family copper-binding protein [Chloroflexi bacterium]|nr:cupredoxin family copper-binding protein [Chloroflexota bacterium]
MIRTFVLIFTLLLGLALLACRPTQLARSVIVTGASPGTVEISGFVFEPAEITVKAGDTITWTNGDAAAHTVAGKGWGSGNLNRGDKFSHRFDAVGAYDYTCAYHPGMKGKVTVK